MMYLMVMVSTFPRNILAGQDRAQDMINVRNIVSFCLVTEMFTLHSQRGQVCRAHVCLMIIFQPTNSNKISLNPIFSMKRYRDLHHSTFIKYYVCQALIINSVIHDPASTYIIYILNELFFQLNIFFLHL